MTTAYAVEKLASEVNQLLAKHDNARSLRSFAKYKGRPLDFMREELRFTPYAKQVEIVEAFLHDRRTVVRGCHGAGKDAILAPLMLYAAYCEGMLVLAISATERQVLGQLWREVGERFAVANLPGALYTAELRIGGKQRIVAMTSGRVSSLTGWHDKHGVFVAISEGQGEQVEEAAFDAAIANAVDDASRIAVVGNPVASSGRFYEVSSKETWRSIAISAFDHPNVIERKVVIPGGPSPDWPAEMAKEFGVESPWYISRVLAEFPPQGSVDSLIKKEWLEAAYERHAAGSPLLAQSPLPVLALDVARSLDRDQSVAVAAQGSRVHPITAWRSRDLTRTTDRFLDIADRLRAEWFLSQPRRLRVDAAFLKSIEDPKVRYRWLSDMEVPHFRLVVDAPGIGGGVVDDARRRGRVVTEYWGWSPPSDSMVYSRDPKGQRFANQRAEVYWNLRMLLSSGTAALPRDALLHEELLAMEWSQDAKGRIVMIAKDALRLSLKRSPDRSDAVVMALWEATRPSRGQSYTTTYRVSW